jgi:hypothetical protein
MLVRASTSGTFTSGKLVASISLPAGEKRVQVITVGKKGLKPGEEV